MKQASIKVFAPATIANLACGFDTLGLAINGPGDEIIGYLTNKPGVQIEEITGGKDLPHDPTKNTAGIAAQAFLDAHGDPSIGVSMRIHKKMPNGSGLGSSAASAVAGCLLLNELLRRPFEKRQLLPFAMQGESYASKAYHADNVAPCLLGGIQLIRDNATLDVQRIFPPRGIFMAVVYPNIKMLTSEARAILKPEITLQQHIAQSANLASLIVALHNSDFPLMRRCLVDQIIEPQRSHLIPEFSKIQAMALEQGAIGCSISGAGPSIFALCSNSLIAEEIGERMKAIYKDVKIRSTVYISPINNEGAQLL
jgi:homoserine kinase